MEIWEKGNVQVVRIELAAGANMQRHVATANAYLIVEEGSALLIYKEESYELKTGSIILIPANVQHMLKAVEAIKALIILDDNATIRYGDLADANIN
nr:cupin domain-containing protein [Mucilaginibacter sp. L294]